MATKTGAAKAKAKKLTKAEMRVQVARDVLRQLKQRKLHARAGRYLYLGGVHPDDYRPGEDLREVLLRREAQCSVCALGALFVAEVKRRDAFAVKCSDAYDAYGTPDDMRERLAEVFPMRQLYEIERAFEGPNAPAREVLEPLGKDYDHKWTDKYWNDGQRMEAIMRNIVRNGGTFKPGDLR